MKGFVFDENLPRLIRFSTSLPIVHASDLGSRVSDSDVWAYAMSHALVIVTKDTDFSNRMMVSALPPWVVHLRFGNLRRQEYHLFFQRVWPQIEALLPSHKLINVYLDRVEAIQD